MGLIIEFFRLIVNTWWGILILCLLGVAVVILLYRQFFKRFFDILISGIALIIASIPMAVTAILVRVKLGKPVLFKQVRVGRKQKRFNVLKFRTMTDKRDDNGELLPDEVRNTKFGKILRKTSLDELPQFINVFKGDMSFIGPRPMMEKHMPSDENVREKRFKIRPGITGLAQVNGRTDITFAQRFVYDVKYAENVNFFTDAYIFFKTVAIIFSAFFKKGKEPRPEDMEVLTGTVEYDRLAALQEGKESGPTSVETAVPEAAAESDPTSVETIAPQAPEEKKNL